MAVLNNLLSPISLTFIVVIIGCFLGRIILYKISLGLSGILIIAIFTGWLITVVASRWSKFDMFEYEVNMKLFSTLGTALFISSIGLYTGGMFDFKKRENMKAIFIGCLMVSFAFVTMTIIYFFDDNITISKLLGCLCGALTTTPGLSSACELKNIVSEDVVIGYGCTYLFGVVATVLFVQIITNKTSIECENDNKTTCKFKNKCSLSGIIQIGSVIILGRLVGSVEILNLSLGNSGGMLCLGIIIGQLIKKNYPDKLLTTEILTVFRNLGLVLFFVGNGISSGLQISEGVEIKIFLYGAVMTIVSIVFGLLANKLLFKNEFSAVTISGGMTSTPAVGVLVEKHPNISLNNYTSAYFGALITTVILIRVVVCIFV